MLPVDQFRVNQTPQKNAGGDSIVTSASKHAPHTTRTRGVKLDAEWPTEARLQRQCVTDARFTCSFGGNRGCTYFGQALRNTRCDLLADGQRLSKAIAAAVETLARKALHATQSFRWVAEIERRWHWEVAKPSDAANSFLGSEQNACFGSASCKWSRAVRLRRRLRPALISGRSGHVRVPWMRLTDVPLRVDYVSGGQTRQNPIGPVINRG